MGGWTDGAGLPLLLRRCREMSFHQNLGSIPPAVFAPSPNDGGVACSLARSLALAGLAAFVRSLDLRALFAPLPREAGGSSDVLMRDPIVGDCDEEGGPHRHDATGVGRYRAGGDGGASAKEIVCVLSYLLR